MLNWIIETSLRHRLFVIAGVVGFAAVLIQYLTGRSRRTLPDDYLKRGNLSEVTLIG